MIKLSQNAITVLQRRYLSKDENGNVCETPEGMFKRVAKFVASADLEYNAEADVEKTEQEFFELISTLKFMPNSPTLMNAGKPLGQRRRDRFFVFAASSIGGFGTVDGRCSFRSHQFYEGF